MTGRSWFITLVAAHGIRKRFAPEGQENIPYLMRELIPNPLFSRKW